MVVEYEDKNGTEQVRHPDWSQRLELKSIAADSHLLCRRQSRIERSVLDRWSERTKPLTVAPKSLLTAAVDDQLLKVYYQRDGGKEMWVTWVVTSEEAWS